MRTRIKAYLVNRLVSDWGDSPWYIRYSWAILRPFFRGA